MPVMDEFRAEREALKNGTPKQKLNYFWDYYKWHTIAGIALLIFGISLIYQMVSNKPSALYGVFLNCLTTEEISDSFLQDFAQTAGINTKKKSVDIDSSLVLTADGADQTSYLTLQKMTVYLAAKEIDVIAADVAAFNRYAYLDVMTDLREVLTPEQQAFYEPYYFYIDRTVLLAQEEASYNLEEYTADYPDPTHPEEMGDPIPVAIYLTDCKKLENQFVFLNPPAVLGIPVNSPRKEAALQFLDYLFQE